MSSIPEKCIEVLGIPTKRINTMITDIITESMGKNEILMSSMVKQATDYLREFMFQNVYRFDAKVEEENKNIICSLYEYYVHNPMKYPSRIPGKQDSDIERLACDYIAGMSDRYAVNKFTELFIPSPWRV